MKDAVKATFASSMVLTVIALSGCALTSTMPESAPIAQARVAIQGKVHGGQQPVVGAHVYLYAAGTGGYGGNGIAASTANASTSLLTSSVLTNNTGYSGEDSNSNYYVITKSDGSFSISSDYTCSTGQQLYIYVIGGNPGAGTNSAAGMLAALGDCSTISSSTYIWVNEVSTIAMAYATAGFATDATHISSSGTALAKVDIKNAFANVTNLETLATGTALATTPSAQGANGTVPQQEINTLANMLASCVNSSGPSSYSCSTLLSTATSNGVAVGTSGAGTVATDTATAAINIAHNPGSNVSTLWNIPAPTPAFQPALTITSPPNDWTIMLNFTGGGLYLPFSVAIDALGNVWTPNWNATLSKFSPLGTPLSGTSGFTTYGSSGYAEGIAIDEQSDIFLTQQETTTPLWAFSEAGVDLGATAYQYSVTGAIAINGAGDVWTSGSTNKLYEFGYWPYVNAISGTGGYTGGGLGGVNGNGIAFDASGNAWTISNNPSVLSKFSSTGTALSPSTGYTGGGMGYASFLAIDHSGNIWISAGAETGDEAISEFNSSGVALSGSSGYTTTGTNQTLGGLAIDGAGNVWFTGTQAYEFNTIPALFELNSSGVAITPGVAAHSGYTNGNIKSPDGIAIDGSGDVWITCYVGSPGSLIEVIGVATPVVTPIAANLASPYSAPASKP